MKQLALSFLLLGALASSSWAAVIGTYIGASAPWNGTRSVVGGQLGQAGSAWTNASLSWNITIVGVNVLKYSYTFTNFTPQVVSHAIFDLSDNCFAATTGSNPCLVSNPSGGANIMLTSGTLGEVEFGTFSDSVGNSNPFMPNAFSGVKINTNNPSGTFTLTFFSSRIPVWGDFYSKGGNPGNNNNNNGGAVWNKGLETANRQSDNTNFFIATPDTSDLINCTDCGTNQIPEPGTYGLLGSALLALGAIRRLRG